MTTAAKGKRRDRSEAPKRSRWEKAADRQNDRLTRDNPLFVHAGVVERTTAADQQARVQKIVDEFDARIAASDDVNVELAAELRAQVAERVSPAELERLDLKRLDYPRTGVYAVGHWQDELARLRPPEPISTSIEPVVSAPRRAEQLVLGKAPTPDRVEDGPELEPRVLPPCGECGWVRGCGSYHPGDCAALRAMQYRLGRCADCNIARTSGCAAHIAEVKRIDAGEQEEPVEFPRRGGRG